MKNEIFYLFIFILGIVGVGLFIWVFILRSKSKKLIDELNSKLQYQITQNLLLEEKLKLLDEYKNECERLKNENIALQMENQKLKTYIEENKKAYEEKIEFLKNSEENLKESFENLANVILEKTAEKFNKTSETSISQIVNPMQKEIKEFKEKVENLTIDEVRKLSALENELKNLKELNLKLSSEAENLTKALKGDKKLQGNWGEMVLERVLEMSGLRLNKDYEREVVLRSDDGKIFRPDVVVHLPNKRDIIIDSKVSLNAYTEYIKTEDKEYLKKHINALKSHIDSLAEKNYESLKGINTLDFIFMFVPIENALNIALENSDLFEYAFKKRIVLTSPSTLLVSLRTIEATWRYERHFENIKEVIKNAEILYDKVRLFSEDFEKIGKNIQNMSKTYESAKNRLQNSIIKQINNLKEKSGIKPKKEIKELEK